MRALTITAMKVAVTIHIASVLVKYNTGLEPPFVRVVSCMCEYSTACDRVSDRARSIDGRVEVS